MKVVCNRLVRPALTSILFVLLCAFISGTDHSISYDGFYVCSGTVEKAKVGLSIRLEVDSKRSDTVDYRLYWDDARGILGDKFLNFKEIDGKYFLGLDNFEKALVKKSYLLMDLNGKVGASTHIEYLFCYKEAEVIMNKKLYSTVLSDTVVHFSVVGSPWISHAACLSEFVFTRKYGFVRMEYQMENNCKTYYYPAEHFTSWNNAKEGALSELFDPIRKSKQ